MMRRLTISAALCVALSCAVARAEPFFQVGPTEYATLPTAVDVWLNSPPLSDEALHGKAVVFYCFDEGCPHVRNSWPKLLDTASEFADRPVLFVGVNSGTPAAEVRKYAAGAKINWPVIADEDRSFEKTVLGQEISLKNITQIVVRFRDGSWAIGDYRDFTGSVKTALDNARWQIDPEEIPETLKPAWRQVEFGNYAAAAKAIAAAGESPKAEDAAAAKMLREFVETQLKKRLDDASSSSDKWAAYKKYQAVESTFKGYPLAAEATAAMKPLETDERVRKEIAAAKQWRAILNGTKPTSANAYKALVDQVERFVRANADTEAGRAAQAALERNAPKPKS